jgi:HPt (histidine-containing phosphotransfer) domain-containing protein
LAAAQIAPAVMDAARAAGIALPTALARLGGKQDIYRDMLRRFVNELPGMETSLRTSQAKGWNQEAMAVAHTIKGLAAMLGADALAGHARDCESAMREASGARREASGAPREVTSQRQAEPLAACSTVGDALQGLKALLAAMEGETSAEHGTTQGRVQVASDRAGQPVDAVALRTALAPLCALLDASDMAAIDFMAGPMRALGAGAQELLGPIAEAVAGLEFEKARALCAGLMGA